MDGQDDALRRVCMLLKDTFDMKGVKNDNAEVEENDLDKAVESEKLKEDPMEEKLEDEPEEAKPEKEQQNKKVGRVRLREAVSFEPSQSSRSHCVGRSKGGGGQRHGNH